jgi:hypothetical protein
MGFKLELGISGEDITNTKLLYLNEADFIGTRV